MARRAKAKAPVATDAAGDRAAGGAEASGEADTGWRLGVLVTEVTRRVLAETAKAGPSANEAGAMAVAAAVEIGAAIVASVAPPSRDPELMGYVFPSMLEQLAGFRAAIAEREPERLPASCWCSQAASLSAMWPLTSGSGGESDVLDIVDSSVSAVLFNLGGSTEDDVKAVDALARRLRQRLATTRLSVAAVAGSA